MSEGEIKEVEKEKEKTFEILKDLKELFIKGVYESFDFYFEDFKISENEFKEIIDGYVNKYKLTNVNFNMVEIFEYPYKRNIYFEYSVERKNNEKIYDILYIKGYNKDLKIKKRKIEEMTQKKILKNLIEITEQFKEGKYDRFNIKFIEYPRIRMDDFIGLTWGYKGSVGFNLTNPNITIGEYFYDPDIKEVVGTYDVSIKNVYLAYNIKENDNDPSNPKDYLIYYIGGRKEGFLKEKP